MKRYLIGQMSESSLDRLQPLMDEACVTYHRFVYSAVERRGRPRIRVSIEKPVFPGLIFVPVIDRMRVERMAEGFDKKIRWMLNTASDTGLAVCYSHDLEPVFRWIDLMNRTATMKVAPPPARGAKINIGDSVVIRTGPFSGLNATVTETLGRQVKVEIQKSTVTVIIASCALAPARVA